ncbi:MAG: methanogen output domain 1-containing protein [Gammaproteobacteria bacterium]
MKQVKLEDIPVHTLNIPLQRDSFLRSLIRELTGLLEDMVGLEEASGFISVVGQRIGSEIGDYYKQALQVSRLSKPQINAVLQDLKARIQGDFYIIEADEDKVVMGNNVCPFGDKVKDRPSLCMMTSNVFGTIAADNNGYAKVVLDKTIARGDGSCHVTVYFNATDEAKQADGREYYQAGV